MAVSQNGERRYTVTVSQNGERRYTVIWIYRRVVPYNGKLLRLDSVTKW
jgi:hypothetical protein